MENNKKQRKSSNAPSGFNPYQSELHQVMRDSGPHSSRFMPFYAEHQAFVDSNYTNQSNVIQEQLKVSHPPIMDEHLD